MVHAEKILIKLCKYWLQYKVFLSLILRKRSVKQIIQIWWKAASDLTLQQLLTAFYLCYSPFLNQVQCIIPCLTANANSYVVFINWKRFYSRKVFQIKMQGLQENVLWCFCSMQLVNLMVLRIDIEQILCT